jgi:hypothetical protein
MTSPVADPNSKAKRREQPGRMLNYYYREAV